MKAISALLSWTAFLWICTHAHNQALFITSGDREELIVQLAWNEELLAAFETAEVR